MMKPLSEYYIIELIEQAQDYLLRDSKHMVALCLDIARNTRRGNPWCYGVTFFV